jgi:hypothetical protein
MVLEYRGVSIRENVSCFCTILFIRLRWYRELWSKEMLEMQKKLERFSYNCKRKWKVTRKKKRE